MDLKSNPRLGRISHSGLVTALLLAGHRNADVISTCIGFGYKTEADDVRLFFAALKDPTSENIRSILESGQPLRIDDPTHVQWMNHYGVFEIMDFMVRKDCTDPPEYFKWIRDALWINTNSEIQSLVNILLFNGDDNETVAAVLRYKYRRKISVEAVNFHTLLFFNTDNLSADDVMYRCISLQKSSFVLEKIAGDEVDTVGSRDASTKSEITRKPVFHDNAYIKWKIGYPDIKPPTAEDFLSRVMSDAANRYYEAGLSAQFAETKAEDGISAVTGQSYNNTVIMRKNSQKEQAKLLSTYAGLYIKAMNAKPSSSSNAAKDVMDRLAQLELKFDDDCESIMSVDDLPPEARYEIEAARSIGGDSASR